MSPTPKRRRNSGWLIGVALLVAVVIAFWLLSAKSERAQDQAIAGVPEFPAPHQTETRRAIALQNATPLKALPPPPKPAPRPHDRINAFVLAPAHNMALIQVNALFNTPLYDRLKKCAPPQFKKLEENGQALGFDLERDLDRLAFSEHGVAMSGFFEGKEKMVAGLAGANATSQGYRDATIYTEQSGPCLAQLGNLLLASPDGNCQALIDQALSPPPEGDGENELYGDLYFRSDLSQYDQGENHDAQGDPLGALMGALSGVTARANVWDDVALSLEGSPKDPSQLRDLSSMARGAMSVLKSQLEDGDDKDQAFASLDDVKNANGQLQLELALSADQLIHRLHLTCAEDDAGTE